MSLPAAVKRVTFQGYNLARDSNLWLVRWADSEVGVALVEFPAIGVFKHHVEAWARDADSIVETPINVALYDEVTIH